MTCAKQTVKCVLILPNGETFVGTNACANPQVECPRLPGEDYTKCRTVCQQSGHAETQAIRAAQGRDLRGATAMVSGHTYICRHCQESLGALGVRNFRLIP